MLVHLEAIEEANAISVATSASTPPGGVLDTPVTKLVTSSTNVSLSAGTPGPVNWKDTRSERRR